MTEVRPYPPVGAYGTSGAIIVAVAPASPADDVGIYAGCRIRSIDGEPLRDIFQWQWAADGETVQLDVVEPDGDVTSVVLERGPGEPWGIEFDSLLFDGVRRCRNDCTFCFMKQLPKGLRRSLYLRDDDYRLSFLQDTFVTLTNLDDDDVARIVEQRISPLRVSLHAVDPQVRAELIGKHAPRGLENLQRLLDAGIRFDAQVVLVPGVNDGAVLEETIRWAYDRPNIKTLGIVPLGYTCHQSSFTKGFDGDAARSVLESLVPWQDHALAERDTPWVYGSDELYTLAFGEDVLAHLPDAAFYGDFSMFEDGIGIIRANVDEFQQALRSGTMNRVAKSLQGAGIRLRLIAGRAMEPYLPALLEASPVAGWIETLFVANDFFGGNVDVTGLLAGCDIVQAIIADAKDATGAGLDIFCIPVVIFNDDGLTVDGLTLEDIARKTGRSVHGVPSNPLDYMQWILRSIVVEP